MKPSYFLMHHDRLPPEVRPRVEAIQWFIIGIGLGLLIEVTRLFVWLYTLMWNSV